MWRLRLRRPRRITIYLAVLDGLARLFDAAIVVRRARGGPWRAEVAEESMAPALLPGDWLLLDPTCRRWPRVGSIVVVREPTTGILAIKRVAARGRTHHTGPARPDHRAPARGAADNRAAAPSLPGHGMTAPTEPAPGPLALGPREGWLLGDATDGSIDSRRYGPLDADDIVARAWFRYGPLRRIGPLR